MPIDLMNAYTDQAVYIYEKSVGRNVTGDVLTISGTAGITIGNTSQTLTTPLSILGTATTGFSIGAAATDGLAITGICGDAIHISGANTATGIHISGNQVDCILLDIDAAADNGLKIAVDDGITLGVGINLDRTGTTGIITTAISIDTDGTTGMDIAAGFTGVTGIQIAGTASGDGILISGACADAIHISGTNTATGLHISGDQVDAILIDGDAAANNAIKVSVDDGITIGVGINLDRTGTTGIITTGISIDTDGTTGIDIAAGFTGVNGISIAGTASTAGINISGNCTTGITIAAQTTAGVTVSGATVDGILISGACTDAIHISGTNTATGLHISGDQVDAILIDVDAAADNGLKIAVDDGITLATGIALTRTGTTGIATTGISIDTDGTTALSIGTGFTGTTGIAIAGTSTNAINITGNSTTAIIIQTGSFGTGLSLAGTLTTGISIGACTTGIAITGANTNGISFTAGSSGALINANAAAVAASVRGIFIGEDSNAVGSGIALNGAAWATSQGNAFYSDDGGVAATGYTETMTIRHLTTAVVAAGDVSFTPLHTDLYLNANYTGSGGLSSIWGNTTIAATKTVNTSASLGDVGGGTFGLDVNGILAASSHGCGVSVGLSISGTNSGIITGFRLRTPTGGAVWSGAMSIGSNAIGATQGSAAGATQDQHLKVYIGTVLYTIPMYTA